MKKSFVYILIFIFAMQTNLQAQGRHGKQNREMIKKRKKEFLVQNLQLTNEEKKTLMPVYDAFESNMHSLRKERMLLIKDFEKNSLNISEADIKKMNEKIIELHQQEADLHKEYQTEHEFKKMLIKEFKHRGGPHNNKR